MKGEVMSNGQILVYFEELARDKTSGRGSGGNWELVKVQDDHWTFGGM